MKIFIWNLKCGSRETKLNVELAVGVFCKSANPFVVKETDIKLFLIVCHIYHIIVSAWSFLLRRAIETSKLIIFITIYLFVEFKIFVVQLLIQFSLKITFYIYDILLKQQQLIQHLKFCTQLIVKSHLKVNNCFIINSTVNSSTFCFKFLVISTMSMIVKTTHVLQKHCVAMENPIVDFDGMKKHVL